MTIPTPPADLFDAAPPTFCVADGLAEWVQDMLLDERSDLYNPDHMHLVDAAIGYLWATGEVASAGRRIIGQAEIFQPRGKGFVKSRQVHQMQTWFTEKPNFVVTLSADFVAEALGAGDTTSVMALLEHELYHCAQATDAFGLPRWTKTGLPVFTIRGHDVEEHIGVVQRYGAYSRDLRELVAAANRGPTVPRSRIDGVCGTCLARAS